MSERDDPALRDGDVDWGDDRLIDDPDPGSDTTLINQETAPVTSNGAADSLRELVLFLVRNLVDDPDAVQIDVQQRGSLVQVQLRLPEEELGKVIGRGGRIAKSMRTALMIAGSRHHLRVSLDIEG